MGVYHSLIRHTKKGRALSVHSLFYHFVLSLLLGKCLQLDGFVVGDEEFAQSAHGGVVQGLSILCVAFPQGLANVLLAQSVLGVSGQQHLYQ